MADEACTHYSELLANLGLGLRALNATLGACARPALAWQVDPFGHSRESATLFALAGFEGLFFCRLDYRDKARRVEEQELEMVWEASPDLGRRADLFTHILYNEYGPPPGFCWDLPCDDEPVMEGEDGNLGERVEALVAWVEEQATHYRSDHVILTMGEDFQYQAAHSWFLNLDRILAELDLRGEELGVAAAYSSPSCYLAAVAASLPALPRELGDFLPYASDSHSYWAGYYTSRPSSKGMVRQVAGLAGVADTLAVLGAGRAVLGVGRAGRGAGRAGQGAGALRRAVAVAQHHDAITGTERQAVAEDYHARLHAGLGQAFGELGLAPAYTSLPAGPAFCPLMNISQCPPSEALVEGDTLGVEVFNPLARTRGHTVRLPVVERGYRVVGEEGEVEATMVELPAEVLDIPGRESRWQRPHPTPPHLTSPHLTSVRPTTWCSRCPSLPWPGPTTPWRWSVGGGTRWWRGRGGWRWRGRGRWRRRKEGVLW